MLKFLVFKEGAPAKEMDVAPSYLIGPDDVPIRSQIQFADGVITCQKTTEEAAALAVMWEIKSAGKFLVHTTRLPNRDRLYVLNVEIARWRLMRILQKLEDWGLFDFPQMEKFEELLEESRKLFIRSLQNEAQPAKAADLADQSLKLSIEAGEMLTKIHSARMMVPRLHNGNLGRRIFGCRINPGMTTEDISPDMLSALNFVQLPVNWSELQPERNRFNLAPLNEWFEFLLKRRVPIKLEGVISFREDKLPRWLTGKQVEFEQIRDVVYEYLTTIATRYGKYIRSWSILSGIHADNYFNLNFEQILDLTRLASSRAKQLCPRAAAVIEIASPWGEYYANNPRSIHPYLYADIVSQSGINFDAFGLQMLFGAAKEGMYLRDFFQISSLIDRFAVLGKPLHITTCVPSQISDDPSNPDACAQKFKSGYWDTPWSPEIQARWFETFCQTALSKFQVESITWDMLSDRYADHVPFSGLFSVNGTSKPVFAGMRELHQRLTEARASHRAESDKG